MIDSIVEVAKKKCSQAYPVMASTGPWPYEVFQPKAIEQWLIKFYCPWKDSICQYPWDHGKISFEDPPGEVMFLPDFMPLELNWSISPAEALSIALNAGGKSFIEGESKPVRISMHLLSRELAIYYRMISKGDVPEVTSDYVWIVVFSTGGPSEKFKVYIDAKNGTVLKAVKY